LNSKWSALLVAVFEINVKVRPTGNPSSNLSFPRNDLPIRTPIELCSYVWVAAENAFPVYMCADILPLEGASERPVAFVSFDRNRQQINLIVCRTIMGPNHVTHPRLWKFLARICIGAMWAMRWPEDQDGCGYFPSFKSNSNGNMLSSLRLRK